MKAINFPEVGQKVKTPIGVFEICSTDSNTIKYSCDFPSAVIVEGFQYPDTTDNWCFENSAENFLKSYQFNSADRMWTVVGVK